MNHVGTTPCGRYFHADGGIEGTIIVGSPRTGDAVEVCRSRTRNTPIFGQQAHTHASLSPDYHWLVFNSDRTGRPQTYAASVPPEVLASIKE